MTEKVVYWTSVVAATIALIIGITNMVLIKGNQEIQASVAQKQMAIDTAGKVLPLNQQLSQALYQGAVKSDDAKIRDLLTSQGFILPAAQDGKPSAEPKKK
ncbi:MAG: hypothetical protein EOM37_00940 [Proteobacteria bacterium]|jgi:hypothetical protein|nr:hypothetical protein [Alphaproteobacteria bacterium]NCC02606.1 hypothetical protein [Pseudomonadota bacterium]